jgi:hypothetical protein
MARRRLARAGGRAGEAKRGGAFSRRPALLPKLAERAEIKLSELTEAKRPKAVFELKTPCPFSSLLPIITTIRHVTISQKGVFFSFYLW